MARKCSHVNGENEIAILHLLWHAHAMYIESVPNRNSPPAILLRESYRDGGKVRKRTLCNLSDWPTAHIEGLRGVLRGGTVISAERDAFTVVRSLPHGHVAAALGTTKGPRCKPPPAGSARRRAPGPPWRCPRATPPIR